MDFRVDTEYVPEHLSGKGLFGSPHPIYTAFIQGYHPVRVFCGNIKMMERYQCGQVPLSGNFLNQVHQLELAIQIQRAGWLIQNQNLRLFHQRLRNKYQLALATGKLRDSSVGKFCNSQEFHNLPEPDPRPREKPERTDG